MLAEKRSGKTDCRSRPFAGPSHVTYTPLNLDLALCEYQK